MVAAGTTQGGKCAPSPSLPLREVAAPSPSIMMVVESFVFSCILSFSSYLFPLHVETGQPLYREDTPTPHRSPPSPSPPTDVSPSSLDARRGCLFVCSNRQATSLVQPAVQPRQTGRRTPRAMMSRDKTIQGICTHWRRARVGSCREFPTSAEPRTPLVPSR